MPDHARRVRRCDPVHAIAPGVRCPLDAVVSRAPGTDPGDYEAAGATWWLLTAEEGPGWEDTILGEIRDGPPR